MGNYAFYNDIETYCCDWLSNLMDAGLITQGEISDKPIQSIDPHKLSKFTRIHFFAGIGGWELALRLAGWPVDRPVWTGSCPCQPFSVAGAHKGFDDPRHLWPHFQRLISERLPAVVFGEQVASASKWLNLVRSDLEALGYAVGAVPIEAASADADHFRDRYWFVADYDSQFSGEGLQRSGQFSGPSGAAENNFVAMVDPASVGWGEGWAEHEFRSRGLTAAVANCDGNQYVECSDGKWRRLPPPRVRWMGTRIPARVAKLRAIGNSIDSRPAVKFIRAYMEVCGDR